MMALRASLGGIWAGLRKRSVRPSYGDRHFWSSLARRLARCKDPAFRRALDQYNQARLDPAVRSLVQHFDDRDAPRFFVDARAVLARDLQHSERPGIWARAAATEAREAIEVGLMVYGARAAPLRPGFPWQGQDDSRGDDLLVAIRPHRFGFAPRMALAVSSGHIVPDDFLLLLRDWMRFAEAQPRLPFFSNLVVTQRLIAAAWANAFLAAARDAAACLEIRVCLLKIISEDVRFLVPRLGDSFPNNHLLIDRFANWFIALMFPEFRNDGCKVARAEAIWLEELFNQTYEDGGAFEHSVNYHGLISEAATAYLLLSKVNNRPVADHVEARIGAMLRMQAELCGPDGNAPSIGDASEDPLFPLDGDACGRAGALREIYRSLFEPRLIALHPDHPGVECAYWLLGGRLAPVIAKCEESRFREYPESGIAIFLADAESTRCTFRTGPMPGTSLMTGHMHSDLLSVTLTCGGIPFLVDPGTYTYRFRTNPGIDERVSLRKYFAGPCAHNGFIVDHRDPLGEMTGDFRDRAKIPNVRHIARAAGRSLAFLEAKVTGADGMPDLTRGVIHVRDVGFFVYNLVRSDADGSSVAVAFQFAAGCELHQESAGRLRAHRAGRELELVYSEGLDGARIVVGRESPANGWESPRYLVREEAPQLILDIAAPHRLTAVGFLDGTGNGTISMQCAQPAENTRCIRIQSDEFCDYLLLNVGPLDSATTAWGVTFRGRAVWLRVREHGDAHLRWLDGTSCVSADLGLKHECNTPKAELIC